MAVTIDDLQVETQAPSAPGNPPAAGAAPQPKPDIQAEVEKMRERRLRLQAD